MRAATGAVSCTACAPGLADLDDDAATACAACAAGFFAAEGSTACAHCPAGYHDDDSDPSTPCDGDPGLSRPSTSLSPPSPTGTFQVCAYVFNPHCECEKGLGGMGPDAAHHCAARLIARSPA